jgi:hypothetical protein
LQEPSLPFDCCTQIFQASIGKRHRYHQSATLQCSRMRP